MTICPKCGKPYTGYPALSRIDGSEICPDCGILEALESLGISPEEQQHILATVKEHSHDKT